MHIRHRVLNFVGKLLTFASSFQSLMQLSSCSTDSTSELDPRAQLQPIGIATYPFHQFAGSPHVRVPDNILYDGRWWGIPFFSALVPHGEGTCIFLEGWGTVPEERVVHITVHSATGLNPPDIVRPAPCVRIRANGREVSQDCLHVSAKTALPCQVDHRRFLPKRFIHQ